MKEYDLSIDDIRWFLSMEMSARLLTYREDPDALAELIWRGTLGDDLYDMEERFLNDAQELLDRDRMDETQIREKLSGALRARRKHPR